MITISDGILNIPECERFVGFTGDNNHTQKHFLIRRNPESGWLYRLYLTFDDGRHNYFTLPATNSQEGTILEWNIQEDHILKSGLVKAQIKAFSEDNEVYHTTADVFVAGKTAEEDDEFKNSNSEFIAYEKALNDLYRKMMSASAKMPYVGENGNWFCYDETTESYKDSGISCANSIGDNSITPQKLDRPYWESITSVNTQINRADDLFDITGFVGYGGSIALLNVNMTVNIGENDVELAVINGFCYAVGIKFETGDTVYLSNITDGTKWKINRYNEGSEYVPVYKLQCFRLGVLDGSVTPEKLDRKYLERCVTEYGETISTFTELFEKVGRINRGGNLGFVKLWVSDNENDTINVYGYISGDFMAVGTPTNSDICLIDLRNGDNWTVSKNDDGTYFAYKVDALTPRVEYLEKELAKQSQITPEFANDISECTDTTKVYVLPDGYIYAYMLTETEVSVSYTNVLNSSQCVTGVRLNSSGATTALDGYFVTNYIPVTSADKDKLLRFKGAAAMASNAFFAMYDSSKNLLGTVSYYETLGDKKGTDENGDSYIVLGYGCTSAGVFEYDSSNMAYIRLCFAIPSQGVESVIVTIDEPVVESTAIVKEYNWANTGHAFVPADYEDRIAALEKLVYSGAVVHGAVDEDNVITITGALESGTYTLKFENADGTTEDIGTVTI